MKHFLTWLYLALFLLMLLLPGLGMLLFGEAQPAANEILAARPALLDRDGRLNASVLSDFSDYIADRFAFRQQFVTAWAWLNAKLLHTSTEEQVLLGRDGWLYYAETEDDYQGLGLTDGQLRSAARNLALMREYAQGQGAAFLFTLAPNKNSLYPEHMPAWLPENHAGSNAARLPAFLAAEAVPYADLFAAFAGQEETLYYASDSHWTGRGAALAADTLLNRLGRASARFASGDLRREAHLGDLYEMLFPAGRETEENLFPAPGVYTTAADPNGGNALRIETASAASGSLLCFRDSFGAALYPYLASEYGAALFSRQADYDLTQLASLGADTLLIELVERNAGNLLTRSAVYPAPERPAPGAAPASGGETVRLSLSPGSGGTEGLVRLTGALPAWPEGGVLIGAGERWFEAAVTMDEAGTPGFSAWLPAELAEENLAVLPGGGRLLPCAVE